MRNKLFIYFLWTAIRGDHWLIVDPGRRSRFLTGLKIRDASECHQSKKEDSRSSWNSEEGLQTMIIGENEIEERERQLR